MVELAFVCDATKRVFASFARLIYYRFQFQFGCVQVVQTRCRVEVRERVIDKLALVCKVKKRVRDGWTSVGFKCGGI